jgi:signal peptidase II
MSVSTCLYTFQSIPLPPMKNNKILLPLFLVLAILFIDQWVKYYVKTHFYLGEEINVLGNWFKIHFTENYGMAFGLEFGGRSGKLLLTFFRVIAICFIIWYILSIVNKNVHRGYVVSWTLILAGAIGNLIDSVFYGVWFGYETWFHGHVVDMLYFPIIRTTINGQEYEFFRPVFNIADASISIGFITILLFYFRSNGETATPKIEEEENPVVNENP